MPKGWKSIQSAIGLMGARTTCRGHYVPRVPLHPSRPISTSNEATPLSRTAAAVTSRYLRVQSLAKTLFDNRHWRNDRSILDTLIWRSIDFLLRLPLLFTKCFVARRSRSALRLIVRCVIFCDTYSISTLKVFLVSRFFKSSSPQPWRNVIIKPNK